MKPTATQATAMRLAIRESLRYFKGGFYAPCSTEFYGSTGLGLDVGARVPVIYVSRGTITACVKRGWLAEGHSEGCDCTGEIIYCLRWRITDAGRVALYKG